MKSQAVQAFTYALFPSEAVHCSEKRVAKSAKLAKAAGRKCDRSGKHARIDDPLEAWNQLFLRYRVIAKLVELVHGASLAHRVKYRSAGTKIA